MSHPAFPAGHLQRGELLLSLIRPKRCADCQIEVEGPPNTKRCKPCHLRYIQRTRAARWRKYIARKRHGNGQKTKA